MAVDLSSCEIAWIALAGIVLFLVFIVYILIPLIQKISASRKLSRWKKTPTDMVILHGFPPGKTLPNLSPFVLKAEAYLRLAKIPYKWDRKDYTGPKGKSPWITLNGVHVADSEFIIQYLARKYEKDFSQNTSKEQLAMARVVKTMLEEFMVCGIALERMVYHDYKSFSEIFQIPKLFFFIVSRTVKSRFQQQGIALHSREEVTQIMSNKLKAVSILLGEKKYFGGDSICEDDCGIFGILAQCLWGVTKDSFYYTLMNGECSNLRDYCLRIKDELWPDWDQCLAKKR